MLKQEAVVSSLLNLCDVQVQVFGPDATAMASVSPAPPPSPPPPSGFTESGFLRHAAQSSTANDRAAQLAMDNQVTTTPEMCTETPMQSNPWWWVPNFIPYLPAPCRYRYCRLWLLRYSCFQVANLLAGFAMQVPGSAEQ